MLVVYKVGNTSCYTCFLMVTDGLPLDVAVSAAGQLVLKLIEFFEHEKSNRPDQR